jgi:hypothetical protein
MRKGVVIGLVVLLTAISFAAGFFVHHHLHSNEKKEGDTPEVAGLKSQLQAAQADAVAYATESTPKLWIDEEAAKTLRELGNNHVWLFRWQGGVTDGWVEFDEPGGPKRISLDASRRESVQLSRAGKRPVAKGSRGAILLTLRQIGKLDDFDCQMYGDYWVGYEGGGSVGGSYSSKGKVRLEQNKTQHSSSRFGAFTSPGFIPSIPASLNRYVQGKQVPWVSIKLVDLAK